MKTRSEIIKMLMATVSESRLYDHFDVRIVVEGFADQLVLIKTLQAGRPGEGHV